ncbi:MAG: glycosyltransferase family 1 protein [Acaryochloridaceae cyanobacterium CSU_3_4]|nr:glycosyltransferase family 1 protein [Acaryochloridaceae cyanobacterium CSU_3_4]
MGRDQSHTWNDYSYVDAIVAVRKFQKQVNYTWKPALKLYNAWHAGVPAILGEESAYKEARRNQWDYLEVKSFDDLIKALKDLQESDDLRQKIAENAAVRAREINQEQIIKIWQNIIQEKIIPTHDHWCSNSLARKVFLQKRIWGKDSREKRKQLQQLRNTFGVRTRLRSMIKF